jgi:DNA-damage-inducible protein D
MENRIAVFKGKEVRRILFQNEWYFSVVDIVAVLTDS